MASSRIEPLEAVNDTDDVSINSCDVEAVRDSDDRQIGLRPRRLGRLKVKRDRDTFTLIKYNLTTATSP